MSEANTTPPFRLPDRAVRLLTEPLFFVEQVERNRLEQSEYYRNALEIAYEQMEAEFIAWTGRRRFRDFAEFVNKKHYLKVVKPNRLYKSRKRTAA